MNKIVSTLYKVDIKKLSYFKNDNESDIDCIKRLICKSEDNVAIVPTENENNKNIPVPFEFIGNDDDYFLYVYKGNYPIVWENFLEGIADFDDAELFNVVHSFILVIYKEKDFYILTAGYGHFNVSDIVDDRFGLDVLERLYRDNDAQIVGLEKRTVVGNTLGEILVYRKHTSVGAESNPAKITNKSIFHIEKKLLDDLFNGSADRNHSVAASTGLKIAKSFDLPEFKELINGVHELLKKAPKMSLNKMKLIKDEQLIEGFNDELATFLIGVLKGNKDSSDIAFINRDYQRYLTATSREVKRGHTPIIEESDPDIEFMEILQAINGKFPLTNSNVMEIISKVKVKSYIDNERNYLSHPELYDHISLECVYNGRKGFLLDSQWYEFNDDLINALHSEIALKCSEHIDNELLNKGWRIGEKNDIKEKDAEGEYNLSYIGEPGLFVLDTVLHNRIELCDLLVLQDDMVYFVHVKRGFRGSIRELSSQILNSAYLASSWSGVVSADTKNDMKEFYKKIVKKYKNKGVVLGDRLSFDGFSNLFADRNKFVFCLAYSDKYKGKIGDKGFFKNLTGYQSTIAKMSLLDAFRGINEHGFKFRIARIEEV